MRLRLRIFGAATIGVLSLAAAACGGGGGGGGASADGADSVPASTAAFISVDSDSGSDQWKQVKSLLNKFPGHTQLTQGLLSSQNIDYDRDVKPAIGNEVDFVWLNFQNGGNNVVGLTKAKDEKKLKRLLAKGNSKTYSAKVGDWWAFSNSQSALSAFKQRSKGDKLSGDKTFKDAMGELHGDALAKIYVSGQALAGTFNGATASSSPTPLGLDKLQFIALSAKSQDDGFRVEGAVKGSGGGRPLGTTATYKSKLLSGVPQGALAFLSFRGDGIREQVAGLRGLPQFQQGLQQFERTLGVKLDAVLGLLSNEVALYVRPGSPIPEISLALETPNEQEALATVDRLMTRAATISHGHLTTTQEGGLTVKTLVVSNLAIHYAGFDGKVLLTSGASGIRDYREGGGKLDGDSVFKDATDAAGLPDQTSGMLYLNLKDGIPLVQNFATTAGQTLPPQVTENLRPLRSFVAYGTGESNLSKFTAFLQIK